MRNTISLARVSACFTCCALVCSAALAQDPVPPTGPVSLEQQAPPPPTQGEIKAMREFKLLDFNGDNKLSRAEVGLFPRLAAAFDEADTSKDGYVSYEEVRGFAAKYRAERDRERAAAAATSPAAPSSAQR